MHTLKWCKEAHFIIPDWLGLSFCKYSKIHTARDPKIKHWWQYACWLMSYVVLSGRSLVVNDVYYIIQSMIHWLMYTATILSAALETVALLEGILLAVIDVWYIDQCIIHWSMYHTSYTVHHSDSRLLPN